jgi:hypothetical protein
MATRSQARSGIADAWPASGVFWAFVRLNVGIGDMVTIALQIGLLIGLYTRQTAMWVL